MWLLLRPDLRVERLLCRRLPAHGNSDTSAVGVRFSTTRISSLPRFRCDGKRDALAVAEDDLGGWFSCSIRLQREFSNGSHLGVIGGGISLTGFVLFPLSTASAICSGVIRFSSSSSSLRAFPCPWDAAKYSQQPASTGSGFTPVPFAYAAPRLNWASANPCIAAFRYQEAASARSGFPCKPVAHI